MTGRIGQQLGNYRLIRLLGKGGFADTYLGEHTYLKTQAAIKVLQAQLTQEDQNAFFNEARMIAQLKHPNIIRVLDFGVEDGTPYLVMDYAPNGTLRQRHPRGVPLPLPVILPYVKQVAAALQYAHSQKLVHRDVKPENMLLGDVNEVLLGDFGVATIAQSTRSADPQNVAGTVFYMAPEQIQGKPREASDQYALAVVVYEWLTGTVPFNGTYVEVAIQHERMPPPLLRERVPTLSPDVEQVVLTALSKDPHQRFGRIQAFANALEQASQPSVNRGLPDRGSSGHIAATAPEDSQLYIPTEIVPSRDTPRFTPIVGSEERAIQTSYGAQGPYASQQAPAGATNPPQPVSQAPSMTPHDSSVPSIPPPPPSYTPRIMPPVPTSGQMMTQVQQDTARTPWVPDRPAKSALSSPMAKLAIIVVAVLLIAGSGLLFYTTIYQPGQLHAQATATSVAMITGTAQANATSTAYVYATSTAYAHATATSVAQATAAVVATQTALQNLYTQVTSGSPALTDPLTKPDNYGWDDFEYSDNSGGCGFMAGAYHATINAGHFSYCQATGTNFSNFAYQAQVTIQSGHSGGLLFRGVTRDTGGYYFRINTDGTYILYKFANKDSNGISQTTTLISGHSSAINAGDNQTNLLTVIARGNTFNLYINKQYVDSASDNTYASGVIGVYVDSDTSGTSAYFHNAEVWRL